MPDAGSVAAPPAIVSTSIADATAGAEFRQAVLTEGGERPLRYALVDVAPVLGWLRVEPSSGGLYGAPSSVVQPAQPFTYQVTDAAGRSVQRVFTLRVNACQEGEAVDCFMQSSTACLKGTQRCEGGQLTQCSGGGSGSRDPLRCGSACGPCGEGSNLCTDGRCKCGATDPCTGDTPTCCGAGTCTDTATDARNCGACGKSCFDSALGNSVPTCNAGTCEYPCQTGFQFCPETDTAQCISRNSPDHCGQCGNRCPRSGELAHTVVPADVAQVCVGGSCQILCEEGWANCNGRTEDGCEARVAEVVADPESIAVCRARSLRDFNDRAQCTNTCTTSVANAFPTCNQTVGQCGYACDPGAVACMDACLICPTGANVAQAPGCDASSGAPRCALQCNAGYGNCDATPTSGGEANGCETNLQTSDANCGRCGNVCGGEDSCMDGRCCHIECVTECDPERKPPCQEICTQVCT